MQPGSPAYRTHVPRRPAAPDPGVGAVAPAPRPTPAPPTDLPLVEGPELSRRVRDDVETWCDALLAAASGSPPSAGSRPEAPGRARRLMLPAIDRARQPEAGLLQPDLDPQVLVGRVCPVFERWRRWDARLAQAVPLDDVRERSAGRLPPPPTVEGPPPRVGRYVDRAALEPVERRWGDAARSVLVGRRGDGPLWRVLGYPFEHPYLDEDRAVREDVAVVVEHGAASPGQAALAVAAALRAGAAIREWTVVVLLRPDGRRVLDVGDGVRLELPSARPAEVWLDAVARALGPLGFLRVIHAHVAAPAPWDAPGAWRHRFDRVVAWRDRVPLEVPRAHAGHLLRVLTSRDPGVPGQLVDPATPWFGAWIAVAPRLVDRPRFARLGALTDVLRARFDDLRPEDGHEPPLPRTVRDHVRATGDLAVDAAAVARALRFTRVGLGIGGGGAVAFRAVPAEAALRAAGLAPDVLTGVSGGAMASVLLGADDGEAVRRAVARPWAFTRAALAFAAGDHDAVSTLVKRIAGLRELGSTRTSSYPVALRVLPTGEPLVVAGVTGHLGDAVEASGAHPLVFPPVRLGGAPFVDGGAVAHVPARFLPDLGADFVIGCNGFRLGYHPSVQATRRGWGVLDRVAHARVGLLLMAEQYLHASQQHAHVFLAPPASPQFRRLLENASFHRIRAFTADWEPDDLREQVGGAAARFARFRGTLRRGALP